MSITIPQGVPVPLRLPVGGFFRRGNTLPATLSWSDSKGRRKYKSTVQILKTICISANDKNLFTSSYFFSSLEYRLFLRERNKMAKKKRRKTIKQNVINRVCYLLYPSAFLFVNYRTFFSSFFLTYLKAKKKKIL